MARRPPDAVPARRRPGATSSERLRAAEEAVRGLERRFHNTVERVADGILVVDPAGRILFANPAAELIFGRPAASLVGTELGLPLVSGENATVDLHGPQGPRAAELRVVDTRWDDRDAFLVSVRDITERREAEERERVLMREQLARLQAEEEAARSAVLAEASRVVASMDPDAIVMGLARVLAERVGDHCVIDVSSDPGPSRYRRVTASRRPDGGAELVQCIERGPEVVPASPLLERVQAPDATRRYPAPDAAWIDEAFARDDERELWRSLQPTDVVVAPLVGSTGTLGLLAVSATGGRRFEDPVQGLVEEIAQRAGLALENARLLRLAEEANRAKSDFLAIVSHELRTPLAGISGYAGLLEEEVDRPLTERERRYVEGIQRCADRLTGIIDHILLFARSRSGRDEVHYGMVPLARIVEQVVRVVRPLALEAGLELHSRVPPGEPTVRTDPEMVRHILLHLLLNAIKFTEQGAVSLEAAVADGKIMLRVSDTGRGILPEQLGRIFEPFSQAEAPHTRVVGGTGIGLNVVQNLVRALGGEVRVESAPGAGSTFTVTLPQPPLDAVSGTDADEPPKRPGGHQTTA